MLTWMMFLALAYWLGWSTIFLAVSLIVHAVLGLVMLTHPVKKLLASC